MSHNLFSTESPKHFAPPNFGVGFVHERVRDCCPLPHETEQAPKTPQDDQPPSTVVKKQGCIKIRVHGHSPGCFRPSLTITLTIYELVPLGAPQPMLSGCGAQPAH